MNRITRSLAALAVGGATFAFIADAQAVIVDGLNWDFAYTGDALPTASTPAWTTGGSGGQSVAGGELTVDTTSVDNRYYEIADGGSWNPEVGSTTWVQFRMKVNSQSPSPRRFATQMGIAGAAKSIYMQFGTYDNNTGLKTGVFDNAENNIVEVDVFQYHTYRVSFDPTGNTYSLWIDNMNTPVVTSPLFTSGAAMFFADGGGDVQGSSTWDYIAWNNSTAPVPEPLGFGLLAAGALAFRRRV